MNHTSDDDVSEDADDLPEMMCPECRRAVTEDTQQCPHCGDWITPVDPAQGGWRRGIFLLAIVVMLLLTLLMIWMGVWPQPAGFPLR